MAVQTIAQRGAGQASAFDGRVIRCAVLLPSALVPLFPPSPRIRSNMLQAESAIGSAVATATSHCCLRVIVSSLKKANPGRIRVPERKQFAYRGALI